MNGLERISNACSREGFARSVRRTVEQRTCTKRFKEAGPEILAAAEQIWHAVRVGTRAGIPIDGLPQFDDGASDDGHASLAIACRAGFALHRLRGFWAAVETCLRHSMHCPEIGYATSRGVAPPASTVLQLDGFCSGPAQATDEGSAEGGGPSAPCRPGDTRAPQPQPSHESQRQSARGSRTAAALPAPSSGGARG